MFGVEETVWERAERIERERVELESNEAQARAERQEELLAEYRELKASVIATRNDETLDLNQKFRLISLIRVRMEENLLEACQLRAQR